MIANLIGSQWRVPPDGTDALPVLDTIGIEPGSYVVLRVVIQDPEMARNRSNRHWYCHQSSSKPSKTD